MKTVIYLEDDEALAYVTKRALEAKEFKVRHYSSNAELRADLDQSTFDAALLDLKIGNETSFELIQEVKQAHNVPVVVLTGYGTIQTAVQAMKLGAINFLRKPATIDELIAAITETTVQTQQDVGSETIERPSLKAIERETIQRALDEHKGNISAAARQLKMHRRTLQRKLNKKYL